MLSEKYRDFQSLVDLTLAAADCHDRIREYTGLYEKAFAHVLCETYYQRGERRALMDQPDEFDEWLRQFLETRGLPVLAWIHHVKLKDYGKAALDLMKVAAEERSVDKRKIALSLAKLSYAADQNAADDSTLDGELD